MGVRRLLAKGKVLDVEQIACVDKFQVRAGLITC